MSTKILDDVKKVIGANTDTFDDQLRIFIGSAISTVNSVGAGNPILFIDNTWDEVFNQNDPEEVKPLIKEFVCLEVKCTFDPPSTAASLEALNKHIDELLFRIEWLTPDTLDTTNTTTEDEYEL